MRIFKRGGHWHADFTFEAGDGSRQRHRTSLKLSSETSEREARRRAEELRRQLEQGVLLERAGLTIEPAAPSPATAPCPFSGLARRWHDQGKIHWSPGTAYRYQKTVKLYLIPTFGHEDARSINTMAVRDLQSALIERGLSASTVNSAVMVLHQILKTGVEGGWLVGNPVAGVKPIKRKGPPPWDWYTPQEVLIFLDVASRVRPAWLSLFIVGFGTGLRPGELLALRWGDVDLTARKILVRRTMIKVETLMMGETTKGGRLRAVPMTISVHDTLKEARHLKGELVFCQPDGGALSHRRISGAMEAVAKAAGLRAIRAHDMRHTFASHLVRRGVSLKIVAELLGHASITTTEIYAHLAPSTLQEAVALLDWTPESHEGRALGEGD